jgi:POT family proton-dependent oligopeptide transporter
MLERAAYYGLRTLIVVYMISESFKFDRGEALSVYGLFTAALIVSKIVGAVLGDLVVGNRKSIIIGGAVQAIGAFSLCIASTTGLYTGLFLIVVGGGLFTPNIIANYGKLYLNKYRLLDSGFSLLYLATNIGAFLGILLIGYFGEKHGSNIGFALAGALMLLSIIPIVFSSKESPERTISYESSLSNRVVAILSTIVVVGLFWTFYEMSNVRFVGIQLTLSEISSLEVMKSKWEVLNSIFILPVGILAVVIWRYIYTTQVFKLALGFVFGAISCGVLFLIPEAPTEQYVIYYLVSLLFMAISELHIAPIIHSVLTQLTNPKYLAIVISLVSIPMRIGPLLVGVFYDELYGNSTLGIFVGMTGMAIIGAGLAVGVFMRSKKKSGNNFA